MDRLFYKITNYFNIPKFSISLFNVALSDFVAAKAESLSDVIAFFDKLPKNKQGPRKYVNDIGAQTKS